MFHFDFYHQILLKNISVALLCKDFLPHLTIKFLLKNRTLILNKFLSEWKNLIICQYFLKYSEDLHPFDKGITTIVRRFELLDCDNLANKSRQDKRNKTL